MTPLNYNHTSDQDFHTVASILFQSFSQHAKDFLPDVTTCLWIGYSGMVSVLTSVQSVFSYHTGM